MSLRDEVREKRAHRRNVHDRNELVRPNDSLLIGYFFFVQQVADLKKKEATTLCFNAKIILLTALHRTSLGVSC